MTTINRSKREPSAYAKTNNPLYAIERLFYSIDRAGNLASGQHVTISHHTSLLTIVRASGE